MENVLWRDIIIAGWPVLSVLFFTSIWMFSVIYERSRFFSKVKLAPAAFLESVRSAGDTQKIVAWCERSDEPLAFITKAVFRAPATRDDRERLLQRSIQALVGRFEKGVSVLGTIASVAPFIGLLGTVIGIIRAFRAVSATTAGGASSVALGIAEALVGTAAGLVVAIPALLAYNYFVNRIRTFTQDWELAGAEIIDVSLRGGPS